MVQGVKNPTMSRWRLDRAGASAPDAAVYTQRAAAVGSLAREVAATTILVWHSPTGLVVHLLAQAGPKAPMLAGSLASAVGARHIAAEEPLALEVDNIVQLHAVPTSVVSRDTQAGRDPAEVAALIARSLPPGGWLAVTMRPPTRAERRRVGRWFEHRLGGVATHYSRSGDALLASFTAGGADSETMSAFLVSLASVLPGFDIEAVARTPRGRAGALTASVAAAAAGAGSGVYLGLPPGATAAMTLPGIAAGTLTGTGVVPSPADRVQAVLDRGAFPVPGRHSTLLVRAPRKESVNARTGKPVTANPGSYPLSGTVFLLAPEQLAAIACPHYGTRSGAASSTARAVPPALVEDIGPVVGFGGDGEPVHISSADYWSSVCAFGVAGTGKTALIQMLFGVECAERVNPSGRPGRPGVANALIAFESKGADGGRDWLAWAGAAGDSIITVDLADPASAAIDLVGSGGSAAERAGVLVSAMVYAFGENAIAHRSQNTLRQVFTLALLLTEQDATAAEMPATSSFMELADALLLSRGEPIGKRLYASALDRCTAMPHGREREELHEALTRIEPLYGTGVTPSNRRSLCEAPQSKVATLLAAPSWWSPARGRVDFETILTRHWAVLVNTGAPMNGGALVDDAAGNAIAAMMMFSLRRAIAAKCSGWRERGLSVSIFSDELSLLAGTSGDVFSWLRNQGRSFGVRQVLATQYPEQLRPEVKVAVMGAGTVIWFQQNEPSVIAGAVADLTKDGSPWLDSDLVTIEPYHAIVRATVGQRPQPAAAVRIHHAPDAAARSAYLESLGYRTRPRTVMP